MAFNPGQQAAQQAAQQSAMAAQRAMQQQQMQNHQNFVRNQGHYRRGGSRAGRFIGGLFACVLFAAAVAAFIAFVSHMPSTDLVP
ncbi:MAG: hypothetical protein QOE61_503 [Micromonosporaceae bacterium]|jgi:thiol:disulfide interchange protein|nr:hypothetical protein [Micromonosporaceae bacterium]